ncbi:hypothetical protein EBM76_21835 [Vibrio parahaemolyticus]|nr:hypothetical protein [Vibrio parahaemolyticus]
MGRLITKRLRRIPNAWHFRFDSALVFTAQWFKCGGSVAHHLTRRYNHGIKWSIYDSKGMESYLP